MSTPAKKLEGIPFYLRVWLFVMPSLRSTSAWTPLDATILMAIIRLRVGIRVLLARLLRRPLVGVSVSDFEIDVFVDIRDRFRSELVSDGGAADALSLFLEPFLRARRARARSALGFPTCFCGANGETRFAITDGEAFFCAAHTAMLREHGISPLDPESR